MEKDKVDKGFELLYDKLSYRRKFIRTIWMILIGIGVGVLITSINMVISLLYWIPFVIIGIKQLRDNYTMWKKETIK